MNPDDRDPRDTPAGGGFACGLTPRVEPDAAPPVEPAAATPGDPLLEPPVEPPARVPAQDPTAAAAPSWDQPTSAMPVQPVAPDIQSQWFSAPLDPALQGVTEVFEAELVGLTGPAGEGVEPSALDNLFGDTQFRDFDNEPLIAPLVRQPIVVPGGAQPPRGPRRSIPKNQKILMFVAGGLIVALVLVLLFIVGTKISGFAAAPAPSPTPTSTPTPTATALPVGPVKPGKYRWDALLGGECLSPYDSSWQENYQVVDCTTSHPAQLVYRGIFDDAANATYPGLDELQKRINLLCTAPTIIDYAVAGTVQDIQVAASFAADVDEWDAGNRTYFCFAMRAAGQPLLASIAVPQVAVAPVPAPTATP